MALLTEHAQQDTLGGGRFRQTIALKRIAFRRDGNLRRIGNALANTGDPALSIGADELVQFRVADRLAGQSPVIHFGKGASNVRLTPLGTNNVAALVAKNVVTYPGAWDNADLKLAIGGHILRKEILLRAGHPSAFAFRIANHAGLDIDTLSTPDFRILQPSLEGPNREHIPLVWGISSSGGKYILTCTLPPGDYAGWVVDPTLVLQPDATDGIDTAMLQWNPTQTYGTDGYVYIGASGINGARYLNKMPLDSLPGSAIISSAVFAFKIFDSPTNGGTWDLFRQKRAWVEAQSTWNIYSTGNNWDTAGGFGEADCEQSALGSLAFSASEPAGWKSFTLSATTKAALDLGNGYLVKANPENNNYCQVITSDNATAADRPKLTIEYTLPATGMSRAPVASWCH